MKLFKKKSNSNDDFLAQQQPPIIHLIFQMMKFGAIR